MFATSQLLVGGHSDVGRKRAENEDRYFIDAQRGIFLVVDGLGGHAAGERAAEIAVDIISTRLSRRTGASDKRIQEAFALASTEIFQAASHHPEWAGMACVATVALIEAGPGYRRARRRLEALSSYSRKDGEDHPRPFPGR